MFNTKVALPRTTSFLNILHGHKFNLRALPCLLWKKETLSNKMLTQKSQKGDYIEFSTLTLKVPSLFAAFKKLFTRTRFSLRA